MNPIHYPELLSSLSGGKCFSKLDLANAYLQLPLDRMTNQEIMLSLIRIKVFFSTIDYHSG